MYADALARIGNDRRRHNQPSPGKPNSVVTLYFLERDAEQRRSIRQVLETTGYRVEAVDGANDILAGVDPDCSGCVVTDLYLGDRTAIQFCADVRERGLALPVIVTSEHRDPQNAVEAIRAGAFDFLAKPLSPTQLLDSVYRAVQHSQTAAAAAKSIRRLGERYEQLTSRERQILRLIVEGLPNKAIAAELTISQRTVETHRHHVMQKLGASSLAELVRIAVVLEPDSLNPRALAS
jgi:two-component system response regulator FixJ